MSRRLGRAVRAVGRLAAASGQWHSVGRIDAAGLAALSCPSRGLCVAVDRAGDVVTSTDPAGAVSAWSIAKLDGAGALTSVACPSVSLCVAVDASGDVLSSGDPTGGPLAWKLAHVVDVGLSHLSCPSVAFCVAVVDSGAVTSGAEAAAAGNVVISSNPAGGGGSWGRVQVDSFLGNRCGHDFPWDRCGVSITGLSCPSPSLCVGVDSNGQVLTYKAPTGWTESGNGETFGAYDGVSCGSESLCWQFARSRSRVVRTVPGR